MKQYLFRLALTLAMVFALALTALTAQTAAPAGRAALVIGNSAYKGNPLSNPVNDATDIAASLKDAGFDVILRTDQDLVGMEKALAWISTDNHTPKPSDGFVFTFSDRSSD
jgi:hypothetical protein